MNKIKKKDNTVFYISLALSIAIVLWGIVAQENFSNFANSLLNFLTTNFGWSYLISMFIFVIFAIILAFSKYGDIKLGSDDSKPEYSTTSWFGMLFGAGMGIGLVFWGVAEPISHFVSPAPGIESGTLQAANFAMKSSFMHWGFHPWANYSIIGLALAYFQFRKNKPGLISSIFIPLLGEERVNGPIGKLIDILAVFATVAGVATSLGLGTLQINSGLNYLFNIPETKLVQMGIILVITILYIWTAVSGIDKGIKLLGDINLVLAFGLLILTIIIGPTLKVINSFTNGLGQYINSFISDSLHVEAFGDNSWTNSWTIFYWAWWIAWAPFVGTFIARISKGRTIREFIGGVILAPAVVSVIWFAAFGSMGINLVDKIGVEGLAVAANNPSTALFQVFSNYSLSTVLSLVTVVLLCTFFITSANSATFVLGILSSEGDLNPTSKKQFVWGVVQALLATSLLLSGGLQALQTASVAAAFPFIFVMLIAIVSLMKALKEEK
ncbi:glycine betaine transporter [Tissierella praeacuta DSM 18095]|uniref:Glycine betaine transporter n=1 Tax=Tissierella praeacuta DSM 18095 TaxID=1123404 RepID=A0A1M4Y5U5_9FIRM|nr:BCCT family transporter [Tissierella praeacuta]TCU79528.1 glycine betaine transporter [Tissierella praeacuta]SHF00996.1 glycine betaine transporter [Tissierella praeacuta DSM 18095]SUO98841.1 Glycine betaine transporter BetP [Tissierella praeacuta]